MYRKKPREVHTRLCHLSYSNLRIEQCSRGAMQQRSNIVGKMLRACRFMLCFFSFFSLILTLHSQRRESWPPHLQRFPARRVAFFRARAVNERKSQEIIATTSRRLAQHRPSNRPPSSHQQPFRCRRYTIND